jgi:hypothetical protein
MSLFKDKLELKVEEAELATHKLFWGLSSTAKWALLIFILGIIPSYFVNKLIARNVWGSKLKTLQIQAKTSFVSTQDLIFKETLLASYPDGSFGAAAKIINPNPDLSLDNLTYSWKFFDALGQEVQALNQNDLSGSTYILPKSTKYIAAPKILVQSAINKAQLTISQPLKWQKKISLPSIKLSASPGTAGQQTSPVTFSIDSKIYNNSPYKIKEAQIIFLAYDQNQNLLAVSKRSEYDLIPYEKRSFKQLWPGLYLLSPLVQIFADTNTLNPGNYTLVETKDNSSDLSRPQTNDNIGF